MQLDVNQQIRLIFQRKKEVIENQRSHLLHQKKIGCE